MAENAMMAGVPSLRAEAGAEWIVIVKQLQPGVRMRAFAQADANFAWDVGEDGARQLYDERVRPGAELYRAEQNVRAMASKVGGIG